MTQTDFLNLVLPFKDKLYRLAKRLLISNEEAEDATQEMVMRLWKNKQKINTYDNVEAFAMRMIKNYCFDRLKSKQANTISLVHSNYADGTKNIDKQLEEKDSYTLIEKLINQLPEQQRVVMQLRDLEQYAFSDIAKITHLKEATVRVTLSRARKTIKKQLLQQHNYEYRKH